jgi:hypothetical protein
MLLFEKSIAHSSRETLESCQLLEKLAEWATIIFAQTGIFAQTARDRLYFYYWTI